MENTEAIQWSLSLFDDQIEQRNTSFEAQRLHLIKIIAHLIDTDYHKLTNILYRIDVDELKLKKALLESDRPISETISDLIIERQQQKIKFREIYCMGLYAQTISTFGFLLVNLLPVNIAIYVQLISLLIPIVYLIPAIYINKWVMPE